MQLIKGEKEAKAIKLTYAQIRDPEFNPCLMQLVQSRMKYKAAKKILKLAKAIRAEQMNSDAVWKELSDKYLEPVMVDDKPMGMQIKQSLTDEEKKEADDALGSFALTEVVIEKDRLTANDLASVEFTPADLARIECLIDEEI